MMDNSLNWMWVWGWGEMDQHIGSLECTMSVNQVIELKWLISSPSRKNCLGETWVWFLGGTMFGQILLTSLNFGLLDDSLSPQNRRVNTKKNEVCTILVYEYFGFDFGVVRKLCYVVLVSITQLGGTWHVICRDRGSNPGTPTYIHLKKWNSRH
jgi:hypothetical protein